MKYLDRIGLAGAVITPAANSFFPTRRKAMKALEINKEGEKYLMLIINSRKQELIDKVRGMV